MFSVSDSTVDFSEAFTTCRTVQEANVLYKDLFARHDGTNPIVYQPLSEAHRKTMERLSVEIRLDAEPRPADGRVRNRELRNWCAKEGIPISPKGKVSMQVENDYRKAHGMPPLETKAPEEHHHKDKTENLGLDPKVIRSWAREQGIAVGSRGRLHPDLIARFQAEFQS